jgi:hypothetical protein
MSGWEYKWYYVTYSGARWSPNWVSDFWWVDIWSFGFFCFLRRAMVASQNWPSLCRFFRNARKDHWIILIRPCSINGRIWWEERLRTRMRFLWLNMYYRLWCTTLGLDHMKSDNVPLWVSIIVCKAVMMYLSWSRSCLLGSNDVPSWSRSLTLLM